MTTAQKKGLQYALAILGACVTIATSAAMMRRDVDGKEERTDHTADVRRLEADLREERTTREMQQLRDSAQMAVVLSRVTDLWCVQNPTRKDCR